MNEQEKDFKGEGMILYVENIVKEFSGVRVLKGVNFALRRGEVHALLGENGAGKSTLMKILAGVYQKTSGRLVVEGQEVNFRNRADADAHGIGIVFQEFSQVPQLSVVDNLFLGKELHKRILGSSITRLDHRKMAAAAQEVMTRFNIQIPLGIPAKKLGVATQQLIEICKALFDEAKVLIMDEPTSALSEGETNKLFEIIGELKKHGVSIIYISHKLQEIRKICDRATILRDGKNVGTIDVKAHSIKEIIALMVGRDIKEVYPSKNRRLGEELLKLEGFSSPGRFKDVSFAVHAGEVVGITGLVGAGKTELLDAIFGIDRRSSGVLSINGRPHQLKTTADARAAGIAYIPEDRKRHGVILQHSAYANVVLPNLPKYRKRFRLLDVKRSRISVHERMKQIDLRPLEPRKHAGHFSGGNQQKLVIAKWLETKSRIYLFDEPTRGVDIGAKAEIYKLIAQLAADGCAILLCSSEIHEIMGISNRIVVMNQGKIAAIMDDDVDEHEILIKAQLGE